MADLERLRELAGKATPGPWRFNGSRTKWNFNEVRPLAGGKPIVAWPGFDDSHVPFKQHEANARYIAAANPTTLLALIAEHRRLVEQVRAAKGVIEGLLDHGVSRSTFNDEKWYAHRDMARSWLQDLAALSSTQEDGA